MSIYVKDQIIKLKAYNIDGERPEVKMDSNENPYQFPSDIEEKIKYSISLSMLNRYPDSRALNLCRKLARYVKYDIDENMIILGDGSDELIGIIISTFVSKGDKILLPIPDFAMYNIYSSIHESKIIEFNRDNNFNIDMNLLLNTISVEKPKLIILCNPNNPTGTLTPKEDIIKLIEYSNAMVMIDEAYFEFSKDTVVDLVKKYDNLIVLRTLSKAWGLAGLRLGYLISNATNINELLKVKPPFNINSITQEIASMMLDNYEEYMNYMTNMILKQREYLICELRTIDGFEVFDSASNFIMVKVLDADLITNELLKVGIGIKNFNNYKGISNCIRISVGTENENKKLIEQIRIIVGE